LTDAVEKCRGVVGFAIGGVFGLFLAGRRSLIGKHQGSEKAVSVSVRY
jgi:hypothetical protein